MVPSINEHLRLVPIEECLAVDDQSIPFKGKNSLKQCNPKKPHKSGYKVFVLAEYLVSVTTLRSSLANLATYVHQMNQIWVQVVMLLFDLQGLYLTSAITNFTLITGSIVFRCIFMYERGILLLGTVRSNRLRQCQLPSEKEMKKEGHGSFLEKVATIDGVTLSVVSWYSNKIVTLV